MRLHWGILFVRGFVQREGKTDFDARRAIAAQLLAAILLFTIGCAHNLPTAYGAAAVSQRPELPWNPPKRVLDEQKKMDSTDAQLNNANSGIPPDLLNNINNLGLADVINIALLNNKQTRQAWLQARAAAAAYGSKIGSFFPSVDGSASAVDEKNPALGPRYSSQIWSYSASASINWLLFDFGGRTASVRAARQALFAAGWAHNAAIQNVILQVQQAYYGYFTAKGLLSAQQAAVREASANQNATEERHRSGVATIADALQARTALSQALLAVETLQGQIMTTRGALATAMGLSANTSFDVVLPVLSPPADWRKQSISECLSIALQNRPDLLAARATARQADLQARSVFAQGLPVLSASGGVGQLYFNNLTGGITTYSAGMGLSVPLFSGFSHHFDAMAAAEQAKAAHANSQNVKDIVTLQVWTSYYNVETADQTVRTSADLVASATENHDVALDRYKSGVGSILDLLVAQAGLESARAQQIQANANWWLATAQLAHDMGVLEASAPGAKK